MRASALLLDSPAKVDLEDLERRLTVLDDKISALVMTLANNDEGGATVPDCTPRFWKKPA